MAGAAENARWTTDWSAQKLHPSELHDFEDLVADLYNWVALSRPYEAEVKHGLVQHSQTMTRGRKCQTILSRLKLKSADRLQTYHAAILRYIIVELVMCCENNEGGTIGSKLKRLVDLIGYLVNEVHAISVELIDQEVDAICLNDEAYPRLVGDPTPDSTRREMSAFGNFHDFTIMLYTRKFLESLMPAAKAFDAYFGPLPVQEDVTFYAVTGWLTRAHEDIYQASSEFQAQWPVWYKLVSEKTAIYGRNKDQHSMRLAISGRAAQKRMEMSDLRLAAFDRAIREGLIEAAGNVAA
ncbi:hypothetical protein BKA67DRAFT_677538 [Truncatella angustata]|uniref:Uncharacterized protein n=1 Tax=Truncatella angustata TaxID=152316 RepID=A0A9P8ZWW2_9PEZI|nr:uncharacterized protein BKA67DRAFT_677538 [Truncatella angustata]KAH6652503.1 hypothetical protein BKA67DRAFT_677538 [Truncatella angustata]